MGEFVFFVDIFGISHHLNAKRQVCCV